MEFLHTGILTESIEKTLKEINILANSEDIPAIKEVRFSPDEIITGHGGHFRSTICKLNGTVIELIQPIDPVSYHASELSSKGSVFHHTAWLCIDDHKSKVHEMLDSGASIVWEVIFGENKEKHVVYMESADKKRVYEIINYRPTV